VGSSEDCGVKSHGSPEFPFSKRNDEIRIGGESLQTAARLIHHYSHGGHSLENLENREKSGNLERPEKNREKSGNL